MLATRPHVFMGTARGAKEVRPRNVPQHSAGRFPVCTPQSQSNIVACLLPLLRVPLLRGSMWRRRVKCVLAKCVLLWCCDHARFLMASADCFAALTCRAPNLRRTTLDPGTRAGTRHRPRIRCRDRRLGANSGSFAADGVFFFSTKERNVEGRRMSVLVLLFLSLSLFLNISFPIISLFICCGTSISLWAGAALSCNACFSNTSGRKIYFTNSKTLVGVATDRNASVTLDLPECREP